MGHDIVLVEDLDGDRALIKTALNAVGLGERIKCFGTGGEAIDYFEKQETQQREVPLILILDLILPQVTGWEILEWLQLHLGFAQMLRMVVSKMDDLDTVQRAYMLGAHAVLSKAAVKDHPNTLTRIFHGYWMFAQRIRC